MASRAAITSLFGRPAELTPQFWLSFAIAIAGVAVRASATQASDDNASAREAQSVVWRHVLVEQGLLLWPLTADPNNPSLPPGEGPGEGNFARETDPRVSGPTKPPAVLLWYESADESWWVWTSGDAESAMQALKRRGTDVGPIVSDEAFRAAFVNVDITERRTRRRFADAWIALDVERFLSLPPGMSGHVRSMGVELDDRDRALSPAEPAPGGVCCRFVIDPECQVLPLARGAEDLAAGACLSPIGPICGVCLTCCGTGCCGSSCCAGNCCGSTCCGATCCDPAGHLRTEMRGLSSLCANILRVWAFFDGGKWFPLLPRFVHRKRL